ncbi:MAG TPA: transposase [Thermoguttaceae bacterium]|nr:transposase [Thermoguttaceae bacterium]
MMSWYRRWRQPGGIYFFTVVTYRRLPILVSEFARPLLRDALMRTRGERPFEMLAVVLLPNHLHTLWQLPPGDADYSTRWRLIKSRFTRRMLESGYEEPPRNRSRQGRQEHAIWQRRGWEHAIRNEEDWKEHPDYIHYNPVKHGLVDAPWDWPYSTFAKYVRLGEYEENWGRQEPQILRNWLPPGGFIE